MSLSENLDVFFKSGEFAETATLDGTTIRGLVDAGFENAALDGWGGGGSSPRFTLPSAAVPAVAEGKTLVITSGPAAGSYRIANAMPDASGLTTLHLLQA